jgi:hypothetical protein
MRNLGHCRTSEFRLNRHGAITPLAKPFRLHAKSMIKPRPVIFPCKRRSQFHKLCLRKLLPQLRKQRFWNLDGSSRHGISVLEH